MLKANLKVTLNIVITSACYETFKRILYFTVLYFHQSKIYNLLLLGSLHHQSNTSQSPVYSPDYLPPLNIF
jgi:hypothetical protein